MINIEYRSNNLVKNGNIQDIVQNANKTSFVFCISVALKDSNIQQTQKIIHRHNRNFVEDGKCH